MPKLKQAALRDRVAFASEDALFRLAETAKGARKSGS
jgi:hypothetical protein